MSVPAARRVVVGVDGSRESVAALRWACREAAMRGAEVHAVHVREENRSNLANYAVPAQSLQDEAEAADEVAVDIKGLVDSVAADAEPRVQVRLHLVNGLPARVLLKECADADMLVLGTASDLPGAARSAGPVIRACLRRAPCPVVVISAARSPLRREATADAAGAKVPAAVGA